MFPWARIEVNARREEGEAAEASTEDIGVAWVVALPHALLTTHPKDFWRHVQRRQNLIHNPGGFILFLPFVAHGSKNVALISSHFVFFSPFCYFLFWDDSTWSLKFSSKNAGNSI